MRAVSQAICDFAPVFKKEGERPNVLPKVKGCKRTCGLFWITPLPARQLVSTVTQTPCLVPKPWTVLCPYAQPAFIRKLAHIVEIFLEAPLAKHPHRPTRCIDPAQAVAGQVLNPRPVRQWAWFDLVRGGCHMLLTGHDTGCLAIVIPVTDDLARDREPGNQGQSPRKIIFAGDSGSGCEQARNQGGAYKSCNESFEHGLVPFCGSITGDRSIGCRDRGTMGNQGLAKQ
jgi:hypothetical protein